MSVSLLYMTAPDPECAERIASALVEEHLAACANILPGATSIFHWNGSTCREKECILILKSTSDAAPTLIKRAHALHPYDCPCIVALPVTDGHSDFLVWVERSVSIPTPAFRASLTDTDGP